MTPAAKTCRTCGATLPLSEFFKSKTGRYGRESKCRACKHEYKRQLRRKKIKTLPAPAGLLAKTVWSARTKAAPPDPWRNYTCPYYGDCLAVAAGNEPNLDFSCHGCKHEHAREVFRTNEFELCGIIALLFVVFGQDQPNAIERTCRDVQCHFNEYLALISGERPRYQDLPHWGRPG